MPGRSAREAGRTNITGSGSLSGVETLGLGYFELLKMCNRGAPGLAGKLSPGLAGP